MIHVTSVLKYNPKAGEEAQAMIVRAMDRMSAFARREAVQGAPKDTGQLINSIHLVREYQHPEYIGGIRTNLPHAVVMEEGRRPGARMPPHLPLYRWVVRHRAMFGLGRKAGTRRQSASEESRLKSLTFLVRRKIAEKGIEGKKFFHRAEQAVRAEFEREINVLGLSIQKVWESGG